MAGKFGFVNLQGAVRYLVTHPYLIRKFFSYIKPNDVLIGEDDVKVRALRKLFEICHDQMQQGRLSVLDLPTFTGILRTLEDNEVNNEACRLWAETQTNPAIAAASSSKGNIVLLSDYVRTIAIRKWFPDFNNMYTHGKLDGALAETRKLIPILEKISIKEHEHFDFENDTELLFHTLSTRKDANLIFGLPDLDRDSGWFEPSTLNLFVAPTGGGKSMMCIHLVCLAVTARIHVNLTCVEDKKDTVIPRIMAAGTGIPIRRLKYEYHMLTPDEKQRFILWRDLVKQYLHLSFVYGESVELIHRLKEEKDEELRSKLGVIAKVDILDYTAHTASKMSGEDKRYERLQAAYGLRKDFALKHEKIVFDFMQVNRAGTKGARSGEGLLTETDLAGSFDISWACDTIMTINSSDELTRQNETILHVAKGREGGRGKSFTVGTNFACARFDFNRVEETLASRINS